MRGAPEAQLAGCNAATGEEVVKDTEQGRFPGELALLHLVLRQGAKVGGKADEHLCCHPTMRFLRMSETSAMPGLRRGLTIIQPMGPEEAMVRAIRVEIRVSIATVRAVATGVTGDVGVATGVGACRKRVGTRPGRGPAAVSDGVRGDRARPVDVWAVAGCTVAGVHTRVRVDGGADSLLGGPVDEQAVAGGAVAVMGGCRGGQRVRRPRGSVPGGGGARAGGRWDQTGRGGEGGDKRGGTRGSKDVMGGAVLCVMGDVMGHVVKARGPRGLLPVDDGARGPGHEW